MYFERDGVKLAFDDTGTSSGSGRTAVLFLHSLGDDRSTWRAFVQPLSRERRVVTLDFRGHGQSAHPAGGYAFADYAADAIGLCDELVGAPVVAVGHSLGGAVALTIAQTRPELVVGLMLEDPPLYRDGRGVAPPFFSLLRDFTRQMQARQATIEEYEATLAVTPAGNGQGSMADVLGAERVQARADGLARLDPEVFSPAIEGDGLEDVRPDDPVRCLVVVLRADPALGAVFGEEDERRFRTAHPGACMKVVAGASHLLHDEQPDRFASELEAFLSALD